MSSTYTRKVLKIVVSQILQAIGWQSANSIPLEIVTDILHRYMEELCKQTHRYAEQFGHSTATLEHLELVFKDFGVTVPDLEEYVKNVEPIPCPFQVPEYPIPKDHHLNFLKPGSREVVTRPVHVHEHLPPMYPEMEETDYINKNGPLSVDTNVSSPASPLPSPKSNVFKRPCDPVSSLEHPAVKRARLMLEEEGRPLREISSVMMTTSGFLSPAREGKLPEPRTPVQPSDSRSNSPQPSPSSYPMVPPEVKGEKKLKKIPSKKPGDLAKKLEKENKKKEHKLKEAIKSEKHDTPEDINAKKLNSMKELCKMKSKAGMMKTTTPPNFVSEPSTSTKPPKFPTIPNLTHLKVPDVIVKTEKPVPQQKSQKIEKPSFPLQNVLLKVPNFPGENDEMIEGKLPSEPDKQKLNIFRKISKAKEEKSERSQAFDLATQDSRESSPGLIIDEHEATSKQREVRMAQIDDCIESVIQQSVAISDKVSSDVKIEDIKIEVPSREVRDSKSDTFMYNDDMSPPGTPSTPRTPEFSMSPQKSEKSAEQKEKKRKKEKSKLKKESKVKLLKIPSSLKRLKYEDHEPQVIERPRMLEASMLPKALPSPVFPFFPHFPSAPGLIPPPIAHPLFPRFPLGLGRNLPHPAMPNLPLPPPLFMQPRLEMRPEIRIPPRMEMRPDIRMQSPEKQSTVINMPQSSPFHPPPFSLRVEKDEKPILHDAILKDTLKKIKGHKKLKKDKDKTKKKKDKRNKLKLKLKAEKRKLRLERKDKQKVKSKKDKKKEREHHPPQEEKPESSFPKITVKLGPPSPKPPTPEPGIRKVGLVIKPIVKKPSPEHKKDLLEPEPNIELKKREPSPELVRISPLVTRPPKQRSPKLNLPKNDDASVSVVSVPKASVTFPSTPSTSKSIAPNDPTPQQAQIKNIPPFRIDADGNRVWICPACGGHDDGSPMIGCDDCDAWYHWVCVGIQVPPDENEDWYCRVCIIKKKEHIVDRKKRHQRRK